MAEKVSKKDYVDIYIWDICNSIEDLIENYISNYLTDDKMEEVFLQRRVLRAIQNKLDYYNHSLPKSSWFTPKISNIKEDWNECIWKRI